MQPGWQINLCFFLGLFLSPVLATSEQFDEELILRPLPDGKLAARFAFTTLLEDAIPRNPETLASDDESQHYTLFPLALGQILREYAVTELHLSLNAGNWKYDRWGYPDEPGVGTGAELWAWMGHGGPVSVDQRWSGLRNALAGLFCASLASFDDQRTTSPTLSFQPEGSLPNWTAPHQLRHATLPSERVCTENLTPFLKLLPCKSLSGIARLLNPHRLFDADWHGLGINVLYHQGMGVEVRLTFQAVFDPVRLSLNKRRDWSLGSIFDRTVDQACPVARSSEIRVELPADRSYSLSPDPAVATGEHAIFSAQNLEEPLDIAMRWLEESMFQYPLSTAAEPRAHLTVQRTLKGASQTDAKLSLVIKNHLPVEVQTGYLETMPWLAQFYLHTLQVRCEGVSRDDLVSIISYVPPVPHARPTLLQAALRLPPKSKLELTMDVSKPFLRYTEHPPDAQRGWDLPPAVLVPFALGNFSELDENAGVAAWMLRDPPRRIYTSTLLIDLPTPDFSMPYNVIILSCTLIALIFGSMFNLLTRKFVVVSLEKAGPAEKRDLS